MLYFFLTVLNVRFLPVIVEHSMQLQEAFSYLLMIFRGVTKHFGKQSVLFLILTQEQGLHLEAELVNSYEFLET